MHRNEQYEIYDVNIRVEYYECMKHTRAFEIGPIIKLLATDL